MLRYEEIIEHFETYYVKILSDICKERNYDVEKFEKLKKSDTAKIVAFAPFFVNADYAEMFAYANLSVLLTAANFPDVFAANENISLEKRATLILENIKPYAKNKKAFKLCQNVLIAISYKDHLHDLEKDLKEGKYNPLSDKKQKIKYDRLFKNIFKQLSKNKIFIQILDLNNLKSNNPGFWV